MKKLFIILSILAPVFPLLTAATTAATPAQQQLASRLVYLLLRGDQKQIEKLYPKPAPNFSQSDGHAFVYYRDILNYFSNSPSGGPKFPSYQTPEVQRCFEALYKQELTENQQGRYTFIHAQRWLWEWYSKLYQAIFEALTRQTITNYHFLRFNSPKKYGQNEDQLYNYLKKATAWDHKRYLFMNAALFGNTHNGGECSALYWMTNINCSWNFKITNEHLFKKMGIEQLYKKYQQALTGLQFEHSQLTSHGNLLLISLSPRFCQENVIEAPSVWSTTTIAHPNQSLDILRSNPNKLTSCDSRVYRLVLTRNRTLKPSDDIRIFAFNGIEPAKWAAFCKKRDNLFTQIKQDIQKLKSK